MLEYKSISQRLIEVSVPTHVEFLFFRGDFDIEHLRHKYKVVGHKIQETWLKHRSTQRDMLLLSYISNYQNVTTGSA